MGLVNEATIFLMNILANDLVTFPVTAEKDLLLLNSCLLPSSISVWVLFVRCAFGTTVRTSRHVMSVFSLFLPLFTLVSVLQEVEILKE